MCTRVSAVWPPPRLHLAKIRRGARGESATPVAGRGGASGAAPASPAAPTSPFKSGSEPITADLPRDAFPFCLPERARERAGEWPEDNRIVLLAGLPCAAPPRPARGGFPHPATSGATAGESLRPARSPAAPGLLVGGGGSEIDRGGSPATTCPASRGAQVQRGAGCGVGTRGRGRSAATGAQRNAAQRVRLGDGRNAGLSSPRAPSRTMQKSVRYNEGHALYLAFLARKEGTKRGFLSKKAAEASRWHEKWFALYQNVLFYFEGEQSGRPAGMYLLEGCSCERAPAPPRTSAGPGGARGDALDKQVPTRPSSPISLCLSVPPPCLLTPRIL